MALNTYISTATKGVSKKELKIINETIKLLCNRIDELENRVNELESDNSRISNNVDNIKNDTEALKEKAEDPCLECINKANCARQDRWLDCGEYLNYVSKKNTGSKQGGK